MGGKSGAHRRVHKVLLVSDHEYLPDRVGGRESSIHDLALDILKAGWLPTVVAKPRRKTNKYVSPQGGWYAPYRIERVEDVLKRADTLLSQEQADFAIYSVHDFPAIYMGGKADSRKICYVRDDRQVAGWTTATFSKQHTLVANSKFLGALIESRTGRKPIVVPPLVDFDRFRTKTSQKFVTFINPVAEKGLSVALETARNLPDIPFLFVEGWPLSDQKLAELKKDLESLRNVTFRRRVVDPRAIYAETKVLFVPSQWEEAFGRVVVEAQASGIPSVASRIGGLPEAVGEGGMLVDPRAPADVWCKAISSLWFGKSRYQAFRKASLKNVEGKKASSSRAVVNLLRLGAELGEARSGFLPKKSRTQCRILVFQAGTEDIELTLRSLQQQSHSEFSVSIISCAANSALSQSPLLMDRRFSVERSALKPMDFVKKLLSSTQEPFIMFLDGGDILAETCLEVLLRAHHNKLQIAPMAGGESGVYGPESGLLSVSTTDFRNKQWGTGKEREVEGRLSSIGYSLFEPSWVTRPFVHAGSPIIFRRDILQLVLPDPKLAYRLERPVEYFLAAAQMLGGSFFVDRLLSYKSQASLGSRRLMLSQYQLIGDPEETTFKSVAIAAFVQRGGLSYANAKDLRKSLGSHFAPHDLYELISRVPELQSVLVKQMLG